MKTFEHSRRTIVGMAPHASGAIGFPPIADVGPTALMSRMFRRESPVVVFAFLAVLALGGCERPIHDPGKLKAVKAEALILMKAYPADARVTQLQWPREIASLQPEFVSIDVDGVHIMIKPGFDGGWGYFVPRREQVLPEPAKRFEEAGQGVYWWHPD